MPDWLTGQPFVIAFAALSLIVFCRAQATYWVGRGVATGALRTRFADRLSGPRFNRAVDKLNRWGAPVVTVSFLTVGVQTVVNAAAGLTRMPWPRYTAAMIPGCLAWAAIVAAVGLAAFDAALALAARSPWAIAAVALVLAGVVVGVLASRQRRQRAQTRPSTDQT